jgi:hypothetical protein
MMDGMHGLRWLLRMRVPTVEPLDPEEQT